MTCASKSKTVGKGSEKNSMENVMGSGKAEKMSDDLMSKVREPKEYQSESFKTLKAWVYWALKNPMNEDQEAHAKATNDLFSLLGTRDAQLAKAESRLSSAEAEIKRLREGLEGIIRAVEWSACDDHPSCEAIAQDILDGGSDKEPIERGCE
jgi:hypothetical protein